MTLDISRLRDRFPALTHQVGRNPAAYLDGPGGTQVPEFVIDAMAEVHRQGVSNLGGPFDRSTRAAEIVATARAAVADLTGVSPGEVVFGQNMTSLTFDASRALARTWKPGDEIVVTRLDHDANITPWVCAAEEHGVVVRRVDVDPNTGSLEAASFEEVLSPKTRLVAVTAASNALGVVTPLGAIADLAHQAGALVYVDGVHYAAHRRLRPWESGADFAVMSAYKFFAPHVGILMARTEHLEGVEPYRLRPAPSHPPDSWETGTQPFASLAGVAAAVDYLASLGSGATRNERLEKAFVAIGEHEHALATRFLRGCAEIPSVTVHGPGAEGDRVATFALSVEGHRPAAVAKALGEQGIFVWSGNYYALEIMQRLGFEGSGGLVRVGFVHYNTTDEVDRVLDALDAL